MELGRTSQYQLFSGKLYPNREDKSVTLPNEIIVSESIIESLKITVKVNFPSEASGDRFEIEKSSLVFFEENDATDIV